MEHKIKILVADNNKAITDGIINSIKDLEYVEIVGTAVDGIDAYNKMIELKPEMVFSRYNYSNMAGLELIKRTKEKMKDDFPIFNTIGEIPDNEVVEVMNITGNKLNGKINPPDYGAAKGILEIYIGNK